MIEKTGMLVLLLAFCKEVSNAPFPWQTFFKSIDFSQGDVEYLKRYTLCSYKRGFLDMSKQYKIQKCYPLVSNLGDKTSSTENILMVSKCPHFMRNKEISRTCLKSDVSPVTSKKSVYKNRYCAICWNDTEFNNLQLKADCNQRKVIGNTTSEKIFEYYRFCKIKVATDLTNKCSRMRVSINPTVL